MSAQKRNVLGKLCMGLIATCTSITSLGYALFLRPNVLVDQPPEAVCVAPGTLFDDLVAQLQARGYIASQFSFKTAARLMRLSRKVLPGSYRLSTNMTNWQALRCFRAGLQTPVKITLGNARNLLEIATCLTQKLCLEATVFEALLRNPTFVAQYGFTTQNVRGMFVPNTYEVYWTVSAKELFSRMYTEYQTFWHEGRQARAKALGLTPIEVVILASLVASETNRLDEAPQIAGVYLNRLSRNMPLQSCPTLLYALGDSSIRRVLHVHKKVVSPYNTYVHKGLPPGPICLPSIAMVEAVLSARPGPYLFFAAKDDFSGSHVFSATFSQHIGHAKRYHRALNKRRVYR